MNHGILAGSFPTKCLAWAGAPDADEGHRGRGGAGVGPWWFLSVFSRPVTSIHPPSGRSIPVTGVTWLPWCLFLAERSKGLRRAGQKREWRNIHDALLRRAVGQANRPKGAVLPAGLSNVTWGLRGGPLLWGSDHLPTLRPQASLRPAGQRSRREGSLARAARAGRGGPLVGVRVGILF